MRIYKNNIKAILFDSGRVLNKPATGHWFITPNFFKFVSEEKYKSVDAKKISHAFREAGKYMDGQKVILTKEEEYRHFVEFYRIVAENIPELELEQQQVELLANDLVGNTEKYVFYDDALEIIPKLKQDYKLAIVSDAWPSLSGVYAEQGLEKYFDSIVISSIIGETKPHEKMYTTALEELNISGKEAVFIDDNLKNCLGAMRVGIHSVLLCRNRWVYIVNRLKSIGKHYDVIYSLKELGKLKK